ncbi:MAG TPA: hypothetical protein VG325_15735, partial [Solirubrobacteraceae bacterium]|nr:hypothetical protein [Solirubrobacteraceae bacterium]
YALGAAMPSAHSHPTTTTPGRLRSARVSDAVVAGYIHKISRPHRTINRAARTRPSARAADHGARVRFAEPSRPAA